MVAPFHTHRWLLDEVTSLKTGPSVGLTSKPAAVMLAFTRAVYDVVK